MDQQDKVRKVLVGHGGLVLQGMEVYFVYILSNIVSRAMDASICMTSSMELY